MSFLNKAVDWLIEMQRSWVVGIIVVVVVVLFLVVFRPFEQAPDRGPEPVDDGSFDENGSLLVTDQTPPVNFESLEECTSKQGREKEDCVSEVAAEQQREEWCASLEANAAAWCRKEVFVAGNNPTGCESLQNPQKDQCFFDLGYNTNSVALCQRVSVFYIRDDCFRFVAQHTLQLEACSGIQDVDVKDDCILQVAVGSNRPDVCNQIVDEETRGDCSSAFEPEPPLGEGY